MTLTRCNLLWPGMIPGRASAALVLALSFGAASAGTLRWMRSYEWEGGFHSREELHHGIVCSDGNFLGCGYVGYRNTSASQEILLLKVDSLGDEVWHRFYDNDDHAKYGTAVLETADGGFLVAGHKTMSADTAYLVLIRTDSSGEELWTSRFFSDSSPKAYGLDVVSDGADGWVAAGKAGSG